MKKKICILSTGQPSTNPRLVKEADALSEAGFDVTVLCSHWERWADEFDRELLLKKDWSCIYSGGSKNENRYTYWSTRVMHALSRRFYKFGIDYEFIKRYSLSRTTYELEKSAKKIDADLYIAHSIGALPAAINAAKLNKSITGFDAEDFYSGIDTFNTTKTNHEQIAEHFESKYLKNCAYISSPSIKMSELYAEKYDIDIPVTIMNVFPKSTQPQHLTINKDNKKLTLYWFSQTIGHKRGIEDVLISMGNLKSFNIELHLRGNWQDGYKEYLNSLAVRNGINVDNIRHHKADNPDKMITLSSIYDIGLAIEPQKSLNNDITISNKLFTYLMAGNALIVTNTTGHREVLKDIKDAAYIYEPGDTDNLTKCLKFWYENRDSLNKAREKSWYLGRKTYNWDNEKVKLISKIESLFND